MENSVDLDDKFGLSFDIDDIVYIEVKDDRTDGYVFYTSLGKLIPRLRQQGMRGVRLKLTFEQANLIWPAKQVGFRYFALSGSDILMHFDLPQPKEGNNQDDKLRVSSVSADEVSIHIKDDMNMQNSSKDLVYEVDHIDLLDASCDADEGVTMNIKDEMDENVFITLLQKSLTQWRQLGKKKLCLNLPPEYVNLHKAAVKEGFYSCDGSSSLMYKILQTNHNPEPNASHIGVKEIKRHRMEVPASRRAYDMLLTKDVNLSDNRFPLYALLIGIFVVLVQTSYQAAESTLRNKIRLAVSFGSLGANVFTAIWIFSHAGDIPINKWKSFIFYLTGAIPPYLAYSMLMPERYSWIGFPVVCVTLIIIECHDELQLMLKRPFEKCARAIKCMGRCLWRSS